MATAKFLLNYRPVKIGFLIEENNLDQLVKAAGINTLLWGGMRNPIIPVFQEIEKSEKLIERYLVDILYACEKTEAVNKIYNKYKYLKDPSHYKESIFFEDHHTKKNKIGFLDVLNIIDYYWEKEFRFKSNSHKSDLAYINWNDKDILTNLFSIFFGYFPTCFNLNSDYKQAFIRGMKAKEYKIPIDGVINPDMFIKIFPLELTNIKLYNFNDQGLNTNDIYIGNENDFYDLVCFWNLRAAGEDLIFIPKNHIKRYCGFLNSYLERVNKIPSRYEGLEDFIRVYYGSYNLNEVKEFIESFKSEKKYIFEHCCMNSLLHINSADYRFDGSDAVANIDKVSEKYKVSVNLPDKPLMREINNKVDEESIVVSIDTFSDYEYPYHTLRLPFLRDLNEFYSREIMYDPYKLRVRENSVDIITDVGESLIDLYPLQHDKLVYKIFDYAGIKVNLSPAGLLANRVMEKLGGIEGARIFKIKGVRKLIKSLDSNKFTTRDNAKIIIWQEGQFKKYENLFIERREKKILNTDNVFDFLLKKDFFNVGLELYCDYCNLSIFLTMEALNNFWSCPYCGYNNKISLQLKNRCDWKYRKSGLFAKENNQEGAIPVLLTILQLIRFHVLSNIIYSTSLNLKIGSVKSEIDFCILIYGRNENLEIGIGECKSDGGEIDDDDVNKLKLAQEKFIKAGIKCYLIFSKTNDSFTIRELEIFKKLDKEKNTPMLFTNLELEPYEPYEEYNKDSLPHPHPFNLNHIAMNSEFLYLR